MHSAVKLPEPALNEYGEECSREDQCQAGEKQTIHNNRALQWGELRDREGSVGRRGGVTELVRYMDDRCEGEICGAWLEQWQAREKKGREEGGK